ncbi:2-amino-4-hydroxy-6-hydroxymethyldihydropteridine diphosphokinase [Salmonella enterica subsp. enterica]|nr:2-amino-4-hydroxy-6-hydroxymethyldihydropteridine diphosphokinase [Salmonella enterica subsp. enterica]
MALGSNPGLSAGTWVNAALKVSPTFPIANIVTLSSFYRTPARSQDQPDYLNAAVALDTALAPNCSHTQRIELQQQGRVRKKPNALGAAHMDLDIMLFGDEVINTDRLTVPLRHEERGFMLWPLFEIAPDLIFSDGTSACISISPILVLQNPPLVKHRLPFSVYCFSSNDCLNQFAEYDC